MKKYLLGLLMAAFLQPLAFAAEMDPIERYRGFFNFINKTGATINVNSMYSECISIYLNQVSSDQLFSTRYQLLESTYSGMCDKGAYSALLELEYLSGTGHQPSVYQFIFENVEGDPRIREVREVITGDLTLVSDRFYESDFIAIYADTP